MFVLFVHVLFTFDGLLAFFDAWRLGDATDKAVVLRSLINRPLPAEKLRFLDVDVDDVGMLNTGQTERDAWGAGG